MLKVVHEDDLKLNEGSGHRGGVLVDHVQGAKKGFCMGISVYDSLEYNQPGVHDDQEGFYVLEGNGMVKINEEEYPISKGSSFIALDGEPHSIKKDPGCKYVKVLWAHGAV